mmetsp:Transcript_41190/g.89757  ORF Transcript_41190/g.89757 Transcript_41190/m.89757 type:complete len:416 (-) Transcript_41190:1833-3080(-)
MQSIGSGLHGHGTGELHARNACSLHSKLDEVQHRRELGENDTFCGLVALHHLIHLINQRLDLGGRRKILRAELSQHSSLPRLLCRWGVLRRSSPLSRPVRLGVLIICILDDQKVKARGTSDAAALQCRRVPDVLRDAIRVERVATLALRLRLVLRNAVLAKVAERINLGLRRSRGCPVHDEIRVICSPPQAGEQVEDMGVIVQQRALLHEGVKLRAAFHEQRIVEVLLLGGQLLAADTHAQWGQVHVLLSLNLRAPEHARAQHFRLQLAEGHLSGTEETILRDRSRNLSLKFGEVEHTVMPATAAEAAVPKVLCPGEAPAVAAFDLAAVISKWVLAKKSDQRIEFPDTILQRSSGQAPLQFGLECVRRHGCRRRSAFDSVSFVEDDATPDHCVKHRARDVVVTCDRRRLRRRRPP